MNSNITLTTHTGANQNTSWLFAVVEQFKLWWKNSNAEIELRRLTTKHERNIQAGRSQDLLQMMPVEQKLSLGLYRLID